MGLAIFDLDGTLTRRDTFVPFIVSYGLRYRRIRALLLFPLPIMLYLACAIADHKAKEWLLTLFFSGQTRQQIEEHAAWFCNNWVPRHWRQSLVSLLLQHKKAGDRIIIVSASPSLYVPMIAGLLGIEEVLCTEIEFSGDVCTGRIVGHNCKGNRKLEKLRTHLGTNAAPPATTSYGDSQSDMPVLGWGARGYLVRGNKVFSVEREPALAATIVQTPS